MDRIKKPKINKTKKTTKKNIPSIPLYQQIMYALDNFLNELDCIEEMYETIVPILDEKDKDRRAKIEEFTKSLKKLKDKYSKGDKTDINNISLEIRDFVSNFQQLYLASILFKENIIVIMLSRFEQFVSKVIRIIFLATPDRLKGSEKKITYNDIFEAKSVEDAIKKIINEEVEEIQRTSYADQISLLDKDLKTKIKDNIKQWQRFIELYERRNLFVHCGGKVNKQYLNICKKHNVIISKNIIEGKRLSIDDNYFKGSYSCLLEASISIGQLVLRKLWHDKLEEIDESLNNNGYNYLIKEKWEYANIVFEFALSLSNNDISDDASYKIYIINKCITLKYLDKKKQMLALLNSIDWSSSNAKFLLAVYVLKDEYDNAEKLMSTMHKEEPIKDVYYKEWPLFRDFRKTVHFKRAYKKIYGTEYTIDLPQIENDLKTVESELN